MGRHHQVFSDVADGMRWQEWLWYAAILIVAAGTLALGYFVDFIAAAVFWAITTLILLALRPY